MRINFVIPVRNGSKRVPNKNFRPFFNNKSLLEIKIEQLLNFTSNNYISINGDDGPAKNIAEKYSINFTKRDKKLTSSTASPHDVWVNIAKNYNKEDHLAYVLCNNPFFDAYYEATKIYKKIVIEENFSGLASVTIVKKHLIDKKGRPLGFGFGEKWIPSEKLNYLFEINGGIQIGKVSEIIKTKSLFGNKPMIYDFGCQSFEIDNLLEFENSHKLLKAKFKTNYEQILSS
jgi:N-acylneuraminate cytidylyltransferase